MIPVKSRLDGRHYTVTPGWSANLTLGLLQGCPSLGRNLRELSATDLPEADFWTIFTMRTRRSAVANDTYDRANDNRMLECHPGDSLVLTVLEEWAAPTLVPGPLRLDDAPSSIEGHPAQAQTRSHGHQSTLVYTPEIACPFATL
jgi:hypothetical protein